MDLTIKNLSKKSNKKIIHKNLPTIPFYMNIYGKSASGKSNMLLNLIKFLKPVIKEKNIFIFQESASNTFDKLKKAHVYESMYDESGDNIIEMLLDYQKMVKEMKKKPPYILVILDDFITNDVFNKRRGILTKLYSQGRHYNVSIITTSQQYTLVPASLRRMSLYNCIYKIYNNTERKMMIQENQRCLSEDEFEEIYEDAVKEPYHFLFVDTIKDRFLKNFKKVLYE